MGASQYVKLNQTSKLLAHIISEQESRIAVHNRRAARALTMSMRHKRALSLRIVLPFTPAAVVAVRSAGPRATSGIDRTSSIALPASSGTPCCSHETLTLSHPTGPPASARVSFCILELPERSMSPSGTLCRHCASKAGGKKRAFSPQPMARTMGGWDARLAASPRQHPT